MSRAKCIVRVWNTRSLNSHKTHLNASVGITAKATIVISTTLDVVISVKEQEMLRRQLWDTHKDQKLTAQEGHPTKQGDWLSKLLSPPFSTFKRKTYIKDLEKKELLVTKRLLYKIVWSFTNNGCEEVTTVNKCKTFCRTIDYRKSQYIGKIAKWHKSVKRAKLFRVS